MSLAMANVGGIVRGLGRIRSIININSSSGVSGADQESISTMSLLQELTRGRLKIRPGSPVRRS